MIRNIASATVLIALLVASGLAIGRQGVQWNTTGEDWWHATLVARDANGLVPRSRVLLRGVQVGEVTSIKADAQNVAVEFAYHPNAQLPVDSVFRVENLSALGETYLSIKPTTAGGPTLADNQRVMAGPLTIPGTIGELAVTITQLANTLDPVQFRHIVDELSSAMADTAPIPVLADFSKRLHQLVSADKDEIRNILIRAQVLLKHDDVLAASAARLPEPVRVVNQSLGELMDGGIHAVYHTGGNYPDDVNNGAGVLLDRVSAFEKEIGLPLYNLTAPLLPVMQATAAAMTSIDTSRLLDASLDALETPGAFTVHVLPSGS
ncbi:Mce family protein [Mycobacteroides abscessus subsp. abscessus]|nr:Mce family protein [Mycobacteroides abscessus subsp. abscessus]